MGLRNNTTFDPYSIGEFSVRDAVRSGWQSWRSHWVAFLFLAIFTSLPTILGFLWATRAVTYTTSGLTLVVLTAVISPTVARQARGLQADFRDALRIIFRRLIPLLATGFVLCVVVAGPALLLLPLGSEWAYGGLAIGTCMAGPFVLAIPVLLMESVSMPRALLRGLFLVKGRIRKAIPLLGLGVFAAVLPIALRQQYPITALVFLCIQPILLVWCAIGVGALYTNLYNR